MPPSPAPPASPNETDGDLISALPPGPQDDESLMFVFLEWAEGRGLTLYPAQEEAVLEIFAGRHVVLDTPTGSGKSLVALAAHFRAFATGRRSVYTSPIKALVSEKFFDLCARFGARNVGMLTGDASINAQAPIICCTAEVLAAMALSEGDATSVHVAVLDEFHYYGDRDRGVAWQLPLLTLTKTTFLLMSATLGDTTPLRRQLTERTGVEVAWVRSTLRPVPLEFDYRETPLHETIDDLVRAARAPIYIVSFTQREAADLAQNLMSVDFTPRDRKQAIAEALRGHRFDTPYGPIVQRFLRHGLGLHHAGLLPRYRLLVEQLAQQGLLTAIAGTDTLGVGINVPIRTVLFTALSKYDGQKVRLLAVRDFQQIAGRAGRKGFDERGFVVCQAPEHVIENKRLVEKAGDDSKKLRKLVRRKPPDGFVGWDAETFERLATSQSEPLASRFDVDHGMLVNLLQRTDPGRRGGYGALISLIALAHDAPARKKRLRRKAKRLFAELLAARVIEIVPERTASGRTRRVVRVTAELQRDFSIHQTLTLFLLHAAGRIPPDDPQLGPRLLTLVEAIIEDPRAVLYQQQNLLRGQKNAELKAEGVPYEERVELVQKVVWPMPDLDWLDEALRAFMEHQPWMREDMLRPKSVARDLIERGASFNEYVRFYGLERSEGVLLRHLTRVYKTLVQSVPEPLKTDAVYDIIGALRATLARADSSLLGAWQAMVDGVPAGAADPSAPTPPDAAAAARLLAAQIRAELHAFVRALSREDWEEALAVLRPDPDDPWDEHRLLAALAPFREQYGRVTFDGRARHAGRTRIEPQADGTLRVVQGLCDAEGHDEWYALCRVDPRLDDDVDARRLVLVEIEG